jgi:hypothetical protein
VIPLRDPSRAVPFVDDGLVELKWAASYALAGL